MAENILELLLNTQSQRDNYVEIDRYDDEDGGIDIGALIEEAQASAARSQDRIADVTSRIDNEINTLANNRDDVLNAVNATIAARTQAFAAQAVVDETSAVINRAELEEDIDADKAIKQAADEQVAAINSLQDRARVATGEILDDLDVIDEANQLGIVDFITNPIDSIRKNIRANKAEKRVLNNRQEMQAIQAASSFEAQSFQAETSAISVAAELRARNTEQYYYRNQEAGVVLARAKAVGEFTSANLESAVQIFGINNQFQGELKAKLDDLISSGNATIASVNSVLSAIQLKQAMKEYEYSQEIRNRNEDARNGIEGRFITVANALNLPYTSLDEYDAAVASKLVTDETFISVANGMNTGLFGADAVMNDRNPLSKFRELQAVVGQEATTPEFASMMARVDEIAARQKIPENTIQPTDNERTIQEKRDRTMSHFFSTLNTDYDQLITHRFAQLYSPHNMTFGAGGDVPGMLLDAVEEVGKWRLNTNSLDDWVKSAISYAVDSNTSVDIIANSLAAIASAQHQGINRQLGINVPRMSTISLANNSISVGDATNPGHWVTAIQIAKVNKNARSEQIKTLSILGTQVQP